MRLKKMPLVVAGLAMLTSFSLPVLSQEEGLVDITIEAPGPGGPGPDGPDMDIPQSEDFLIGLAPEDMMFNIALPMEFATQPMAAAPGFQAVPPQFGAAPGRFAGFAGRGCGMGGGDCLRGLNLSDEQYEKMYGIKNQFLDQVGPKMLEVRTLERHLKDVLTSPSLDAGKAKSLQSKINALKSDLANAKLENKLAMLDVLTAEQRKEIRERVIKGGMMGGPGMRRMIHHRMKKFGPGPGGPREGGPPPSAPPPKS